MFFDHLYKKSCEEHSWVGGEVCQAGWEHGRGYRWVVTFRIVTVVVNVRHCLRRINIVTVTTNNHVENHVDFRIGGILEGTSLFQGKVLSVDPSDCE
jgi:hypothetical protein